MSKQVIFVADDFGMDRKTNEAIIHAHVAGALQAAALMVAQPGTDKAVALAKEYPKLEIGWHLHLNDSFPATWDDWPWGASPVRAGLSFSFSRKAQEMMRREVAKQWELFQKTGLTCQFVNCHHHLQAHPLVFQTLREVVGSDFKGWIRLGQVRFFQPSSRYWSPSLLVEACFKRRRKLSTWRSSDTLWGLDRLFRMKAPEVRAAVATLPDGLHEFLFHPCTLSCPDTQCLLELKSATAP